MDSVNNLQKQVNMTQTTSNANNSLTNNIEKDEGIFDSLLENTTLSEEGKEKAKNLLSEYSNQDVLGILDEYGHFPKNADEMKQIFLEHWQEGRLAVENHSDYPEHFLYDSDGDGVFDRSVMYYDYTDGDGTILKESFFDKSKSQGEIFYQGWDDDKNESGVFYDNIRTPEGFEFIEKNNYEYDEGRIIEQVNESTGESIKISYDVDSEKIQKIEQFDANGERL